MASKKINIVTLGCSKNLVDSEHLMKQFEAGGFDVVFDSNDEDADIVVINTCGFILDAKEESVETIMNFVKAKQDGVVKKLFVMGCLSARYGEELKVEIPEVDRFFGKFDFNAILEAADVAPRFDLLTDRKITTPSHYAYLKLAEGCNRSCSFCAIPGFTGKYCSVSIDDLVEEAKKLADNGVKELLLIAQDISYYGIDLYGENRLAQLVDELSKIDGIQWIKLHYAYPQSFPYQVLTLMRENPKVCKYLDIPLQHAADNVLSKMRRNIDGKATREIVSRIREEVPGVSLRTTLMVGHPGETEADFEELKAFVQLMKFERLGVFAYSHEEDTYAWKHYKDDISDDVKQSRFDEIMELQQTISAEKMGQRIGQILDVIIDREEDDYFVGRTEFDSPEVDGEVYITSPGLLTIGSIYKVRITSADAYDLYAETLMSI